MLYLEKWGFWYNHVQKDLGMGAPRVHFMLENLS